MYLDVIVIHKRTLVGAVFRYATELKASSKNNIDCFEGNFVCFGDSQIRAIVSREFS
jgi:hypothetical protein